jgi:hypothetical protein
MPTGISHMEVPIDGTGPTGRVLNSNWHWCSTSSGNQTKPDILPPYFYDDNGRKRSDRFPPLRKDVFSTKQNVSQQTGLSAFLSSCLNRVLDITELPTDETSVPVRLGPHWNSSVALPACSVGRFRCAAVQVEMPTLLPLSRLGCTAGPMPNCRWSLR